MIYFQSAAVRRFIFKFTKARCPPGSFSQNGHPLLGFAVFGGDDGVQLPDGLLHCIVDDEIIVGMGGLEFHLGPEQPLLHLIRIVGAAVSQADSSSFQLGGAMKIRTVSGRLLVT